MPQPKPRKINRFGGAAGAAEAKRRKPSDSRAGNAISAVLDVEDPLEDAYALEVSSPGLERPLRTPQHFQREINKVVSVRLHRAIDSRRRLQGVLLRAYERGIVIFLDDTGTEMSVSFDDIERARTVFVWGAEKSTGRSGTSSDRHTKEVAS